MAPRTRTSKTQFSPLGHFTLSDPKFPKLLEPLVGRRTAKQKSLAAQKTVRHLLKKHSLIDQAQEADHFSIFETSPSALQLNIPLEDSPGTPDNYLNSFPLNKYSVSSSARKRPLSRLKTKQAEPSPEVLKPLKNVVLHEKYINQLSRREGAKKPRKKASGTIATDPENERHLLEQQAGVVKAAKNALMTEATDFICQFKKLQANSLAHILENCEDDVDNCT
jgi:protein DEK